MSVEADRSPRQFSADRDARPIASGASGESYSSAGQQTLNTLRFVQAGWGREAGAVQSSDSSDQVLRWRHHPAAEAMRKTNRISRQAAGAWEGRPAGSSSTTRLVTHEAFGGPFDDPFGDRLAQDTRSPSSSSTRDPQGESRGSGFVLQGDAPSNEGFATPADGTEPAPGTSLPLPPLDPQTPSLGFPSQSTRQTTPPDENGEDSAPPLPPGLDLPDFSFPSPSRPSIPESRQFGTPDGTPLEPPSPSLGPPSSIFDNDLRRGTPCERIYNDRNCCEEDTKCKTARQALRDNRITKISLDITGPFKPDATSAEEEREARENQIRLMPARAWKNREGEVLAQGRLRDIRNRRIEISNEDGSTVTARLGELSDDDLCFLAAWWGVPTECTLGDDQFVPRAWEPVAFTWKASGLCHKPLYFEQVQLERYGHTTGPVLQPALSGAHFFLNIALLPYKMGMNPPNECQYALGYYRPGSCAPWLVPPVPLSVRGGLLQAGTIVGIVGLFP
jgi:hypothetical protein